MNGFVACSLLLAGVSATGHANFLAMRTLPEEKMSAMELITSKGYTAEEHRSVTEDGYILTLHRIKCRRNETNTAKCEIKRPAVLVMHGLLCSSTNWITNLANESLGFLLADAGFDVWLGNARGNTYSSKHIKLHTDQIQFWQFSFDEMAQYDMPGMVDYALNVTGQQSMYYIGHSQGTVMAFAQLSQDQQFAAKIKKFYALGPVNTVAHVTGVSRYLAETMLLSWPITKFIPKSFMPTTEETDKISEMFCTGDVGSKLCENFLFLVAGRDSNQMNSTRLPVYFAHTPAGTSYQNLAHYGQLVESKTFQKFNYGLFGNIKKYGTLQPPLYDISTMTTPVDLYCGENDTLADPADIQESLIPKLKADYQFIKLPDFNHLDFLWGMRAPKVVYCQLLET